MMHRSTPSRAVRHARLRVRNRFDWRLGATALLALPGSAQASTLTLISAAGTEVAPAAAVPGDAVRLGITVAASAGTDPSRSDIASYVVAPSGSTVGSLFSPTPLVIAPGSSATEALSYAVPSSGAALGGYRVVTYARDRATGQSVEFPDAHFTVSSPGAGAANLLPTLDETFGGGALNGSIWSPFFPTNEYFGQSAWLGDEVQAIGGAGLRIRADRRADQGRSYASGVITSFGGFAQTYGYFEIVARLPQGNGLWPAFWLLPADQSWPPELDVVELIGRNPGTIYTTLHYPTANGGRAETDGSCSGQNLAGAWHRYGVAWRPGSLVWSVDGTTCFSTSGASVPNRPMYLLADLAVGAADSWGGAPDASTVFPANMDVASIRAWQYSDLAQATPAQPGLGKTVLSSTAPSGGQLELFTSTVRAGSVPLTGAAVTATVFPVNSSQALQPLSSTAWASPIAAGQSARLPMHWTVPQGLPAGVYNVAVNLVANGGLNTWNWVAGQLRIGHAPTLPADPAPFPPRP